MVSVTGCTFSFFHIFYFFPTAPLLTCTPEDNELEIGDHYFLPTMPNGMPYRVNWKHEAEQICRDNDADLPDASQSDRCFPEILPYMVRHGFVSKGTAQESVEYHALNSDNYTSPVMVVCKRKILV